MKAPGVKKLAFQLGGLERDPTGSLLWRGEENFSIEAV